MINLLPEIQKEELKEEENLKIIFILGLVILTSFLSFCLILFSIKTVLNGKLEVQKIVFTEREKELKISNIEESEEDIKKYNSVFSKFNSFYDGQISFVEIFDKLSKTLPKGVYLKTLNLNQVTEGKGGIELSFSGFCPDRENLIILKENLEKEKKFSEIYFPPSNWLEPTDIDFSIKLKIIK